MLHRLHRLTAPGYLVALGVLLLNDRVWKGAAPSVWTGKLSDLAGLVVLPVLLCALTGVATRRGAWRVHVAVGVVFAAMQFVALDVPLGALRSATGLALAHTPDPTDLVALAMLPLGVALARRRPAPWAHAGMRRAALALSVLAVAGTSAPPEEPLFEALALGTAPTAEAAFDAVDRALAAQDLQVTGPEPIDSTDTAQVRRAYSITLEHRVSADSAYILDGWIHLGWKADSHQLVWERDDFATPGRGTLGETRPAVTETVRQRVLDPIRASLAR